MKHKIIDFLKKYRYGIITILVVCLVLAFFWGYIIKDTYMPVQHISSVTDGGFNVTTGEIRTISIKTADGYERDMNGITVSIKDTNGNEVWSGGADKIDVSEEEAPEKTGSNADYDLIFESEAGGGISLPTGRYFIGTDQDTGDFKSFIFNIHEYRSSYGKLYLIISVEIMLISLLVIILIYNREKVGLHKTFLLLAIAFGILVNTIFPPLSVPDEKVHFREAYEASSSLYNKLNFNHLPTMDFNGKIFVRATDYDSIMYLHDMASVAGWYEGIWDKADYRYVPVDFDSTVTTRTVYVYVPASVGIIIARGLRLNGRWMLYMGRFTSFALCLLILYLSVKLLPRKKELMTLIALMPQCIYLFMSYSYDGLNLALCFLIVSLIFNLCENTDGKRIVKLIVLCLTLLLMIPIKMAYFPYVLLLLLIINPDRCRKLLSDKKARIVILLAGAAAVAVLIPIVISGWDNIAGMIGFSSTGQFETSPESRISLGYVLSDIPSTIKRYYNTVWYNSGNYLSQMVGAVSGGLRDGIHTYRMPAILLIFETVVVLLSATENDNRSIGWLRKLIVWITGILCILMIYTGLLLGDTKVVDWRITGVQGRYFLPVLFLLPMGVDITAIKIDEDKKNIISIAGCAITFLLFFFLAFYYYATNYFSELI